MKSIRRNFYKAKQRDPSLGDYTALVYAVRYKQYTRRTIRKNLCLLDDSDMDERMKKQLTDHLYGESQRISYEDQNSPKIPSSLLLEEITSQYLN